MPLDPEKIASALDLDEDIDAELITVIKERIEKRLDELHLDKQQMRTAESIVLSELGEWPTNAAVAREAMPTRTDKDGWLKGVEKCMERAGKQLEDDFALTTEIEDENLSAFNHQKEEHKKEAERLDEEAEELGLPTVEELREVGGPSILSGASMDEVTARRLGEGEAIGTGALASCTGVTLFDPVTKVGAVMHVYQGKVTIEDALAKMQEIDSTVDPSRLQATLMPGTVHGVNMSHLESLREQLSSAGITKIRDFSKEGRTSSDLLLKGDGGVVAGLKTGESTSTSTTKDELDPEVPAKKPSVGEVLGIGKRASTSTSTSLGQGMGQGAGSPSKGGRMGI